MGLFDKLFGGLGKTRQQIDLEELFQGYAPDSEDFYDNLEEMLILSDAGMETAERVDYLMRRKTWEDRYRKGEEAREGLIKILTGLLNVGETELKLTTKPSVILMVERSGADFVRHEEGSDPAAVVYDGICAAKARDTDVILIDTAGRLHNKANLMNELNKIRRIIDRELPEADVETLMVLDATTGQNGLLQAKQFLETCGITGIVLTKLDGTAKGGIVFAIANECKLPVKYVGVGEGIDDLIPFDGKNFVEALFKE